MNRLRNVASFGEWMFKRRDYTAIPLLLLFLVLAKPSAPMFAVGALLIAVGEGIRIRSLQFIGGASRTRGDGKGKRLCRFGPYSRVRNPLYIGNFFQAVGVGALSGRTSFFAIAAAAFAAQYVPIVRWEESRLREDFGAEYEAYCRETPRWFPRCGRISASPPDRTVSEALRIERRTFIALAMTVLLFAARLAFANS